MKKLRSQFFIFHIIFLICILCCTSHTYAAAAGSQADSPGTKGAKPLSFISCTLEDGSKIDNPNGITLQPKFKFEFDKNVVNMLVWENNSKCFSLYTDSVNVPITVSKIDDTVNQEMKQIIFMHPKNSLEPGKTYYIKISPELMAKNQSSILGGTTNEKEIILSFKTQGKAAKSDINSGSSTANSTEVNPSDNQAKSSSTAGKMTLNNWIELVSGIVIAGWLITEFYFKKKLKKGRNDKPSV